MTDFVLHRWVSPKTKVTYQFKNGEMGVAIFEDDTIDSILQKVVTSIVEFHKQKNESHLIPSIHNIPYVWTKRTPIRFTISDTSYPVNPWLAVDMPVLEHVSKVTYHNDSIVEHREWNIVFSDDLPSHMRRHAMYFPDVGTKWNLNSYAAIQKESTVLSDIWTRGKDTRVPFVITRSRWISIPSSKPLTLDLFALFESLHTSASVPFLQHVHDSSKILYKVYQKHNIPSSLLEQWTSVEKMPKVSAIVGMFYHAPKDVYARAVLEENGSIFISTQADVRTNVTWKVIAEFVEAIQRWFEAVLHTKRRIQTDSVSCRFDVATLPMGVNFLSKKLSNVPALFHVSKMQDGVLEVAMKRSKNYTNKLDISDYISARVRLGIPLRDVIQDLMEMGLSRVDAEFWLEQYQNVVMDAAPKKKTLSSTGCILRISRSPAKFQVYIDNAQSHDEILRICQWVVGTINLSLQDMAGPSMPAPTAPSRRKSSSTSSSSDHQNTLRARDLLQDVDLDDLEFDGGGSFLSELQKADDGIFLQVKDYARKCAANNNRQPVVVSPAEWDKLKSQGFDGVDNHIRYGSDASKENIYMCPRIWCPLSKVPLTLEQLQKNNGKCPGPHFEAPMNLYEDPSAYWENDASKPHYVGFLKHKTPSGVCVPCCMKKQPKPDEMAGCKIPNAVNEIAPQPKNAVSDDVKDDAYIMNAAAPIPPKRAGVIPKDLHQQLMPSLAHAMCTKTVSSTACYLRTGMERNSDSLMSAIAYALGMNTKLQLCQEIQKRLDPLTFLSLEDGMVVRAFLPEQPVEESKKLEKLWSEWVKKFPAYIDTFDLRGNISEDRLVRELSIFSAYTKFMEHLKSSEPKNPQHLIQLLGTFGVHLVLWKKQGNQHASLTCPLTMRFDAKNVVMLLEENGVYEPIELRERGKVGVSIHPISTVPKVATILQQCGSVSPWPKVLASLARWTQHMLYRPTPFTITTVVLQSDLRIYGFLTKGNMLLLAPNGGLPAGMLPSIMEALEIKNVVYLEDVQGAKKDVENIVRNDFILMHQKLQQVGMHIYSATALLLNPIISFGYTIPSPSLLIAPAIPIAKKDKDVQKMLRHNAKWLDMARYVASTFADSYDTLVKPLLKRKRIQQVTTLMRTFPHVPNKKQLQIIIEEIPYKDGKDAIQAWIRLLGIEAKTAIFYQTHVRNDKKEWIFSQAAVENGMPWSQLRSRKGPIAHIEYNPIDQVTEELKPTVAPNTSLPSFLKGDRKKLPSKFADIRAYSWRLYRICVPSSTYDPSMFSGMISWLSQGIPITWEEIMFARRQLVATMLMNESTIEPLLDDTSFIHAWSEHFKKSIKKPTDIWTKHLAPIPLLERRAVWQDKVAMMVPPMDIDIYLMAKMLKLNVLLLYRGKHGEKAGTKRGDLPDLMTSSTFFTSSKEWKEDPCIVMYKEKGNTMSEYFPIVDENDRFLHPVTKNMPNDVVQLMEYVYKHKEAMF